jgi:hypothetical protein
MSSTTPQLIYTRKIERCSSIALRRKVRYGSRRANSTNESVEAIKRQTFKARHPGISDAVSLFFTHSRDLREVVANLASSEVVAKVLSHFAPVTP